MSVCSVMLLPPQKVAIGACTHEVTVRRIGKWWHCRVFTNGQLNQECKVNQRSHIGAACRDLLRWEDKCGNISDYASAARHRPGKKAAASME